MKNNTAPEGQNLMVLKGIVLGLGVLLVLGTVAICVKIATGFSDTDKDSPAGSTISAVADMPPLPKWDSEVIIEVSAGEGLIFVLLEDRASAPGKPVQRRVMTIPSAGGTEWTALPLAGDQSLTNP